MEKFEFSEASKALAELEINKYPPNQKQSAVMALLTIAQKQNANYLSRVAIEYVATYLNMPIIKVLEVATFYSMYNLEPVGKYHIQLCSNVVCHVKGFTTLLAEVEKITGTKAGTTSSDNLFTVSKVECLGACANAPVMQINEQYFEDLTSKDVKFFLTELKKGHEITAKNAVKAPLHLIDSANSSKGKM